MAVGKKRLYLLFYPEVGRGGAKRPIHPYRGNQVYKTGK